MENRIEIIVIKPTATIVITFISNSVSELNDLYENVRRVLVMVGGGRASVYDKIHKTRFTIPVLVIIAIQRHHSTFEFVDNIAFGRHKVANQLAS